MNVFEGTIPDLAPYLKNAAQLSSVTIQGYIGTELGDRAITESYREGKSSKAHDDSTAKNHTDTLRTATGRLFKSFQVKGQKSASSDGIFDIKIDDKGVLITIGTKLEYAALHEFGGTVPAHFVKSKGHMHKYFWAKYYATHEEKFKWAALKVLKHGGINIKAVTMPARPFFFKAVKQFETQGMQTILQHLATEVLQAMSKG